MEQQYLGAVLMSSLILNKAPFSHLNLTAMLGQAPSFGIFQDEKTTEITFLTCGELALSFDWEYAEALFEV